MRIALPLFLAVFLTPCALAAAEDGDWSGSYDAWKAALDRAEHSVNAGANRPARAAGDALARAEQSRARIEQLASSLRDRSGDVDSATFHAKLCKDEFESAKRDADRFDQQIDAKAKSLKEDISRLTAESDSIDARSAKLKAWLQRRNDWRAQIESRRHVFQLPAEQGAFDAFNAEVTRFNADTDSYNAERDAAQADLDKWNLWRTQLEEIRKLIVEDGRHVLDMRQVESKKEREYVEAQQKLAKLTAQQQQEASQLSALLGPSLAELEGIAEALDSPPTITLSAAPAAGPYVPRDEAAAQAVALPASSGHGGGAAGAATDALRDRIFVLPPAGAASPEEAAAQTAKRRLAVAIAADDLSAQYTQVTPDRAAEAAAPTGAMALNGDVPIAPGPPDASSQSDPATAAALHDADVVPALDPRGFITRDEYESALAARNRLTGLVPKLEAQLEKVRAQRGNTLEYQAEFEAIRAEAARGALRDALGVLPVSATLKRLAADPRLAASLTPQVIARVEAAMTAVRAEITREQAPLAPEPEERRKLRIEAIRQGGEALLSACVSGLAEDGAAHLMLEQMGKTFQVYSKFSDYLNDPKAGERPPWQEAGELVKLGIDVAGVYCAPVALGAGLESLGERAATRIIIRSAMDDLSDSLKSNYDAERFLTDKIERTRGFVDELNRTTSGYEAIHRPPAADASAPTPTTDNGSAP